MKKKKRFTLCSPNTNLWAILGLEIAVPYKREKTGCQRFLQATGLFVAIFREEGLNLTQADSITSICDCAWNTSTDVPGGTGATQTLFTSFSVHPTAVTVKPCALHLRKKKEKKQLITDASQSLWRGSGFASLAAQKDIWNLHWCTVPSYLTA